MRCCLRDTDTIARFGGDEFVIVQTEVDRPLDAADLAQAVRAAVVNGPVEVDGHQVVIDASVGIALAPGDSTNADELLKFADMALYSAKADGRGSYSFFEPKLDARMKSRRSLEFDLRRAMTKGEFELHYQPVVSIADGSISGFEALLRWRHPERGPISPAEFIPIAEEIGLIVPLGEWVLRQACAEAMNWPAPLRVSVNISPVHFIGRNLVPAIVASLAASGLDADRLEVEITEAVLLQNTERTLATMRSLRELGVRIAMDDFGVGYSSLSYLRNFPFTKIKIDRSFVQDVVEQESARSIVRAVIALGASLGMTTTAEGIETQQQLDLLRAEGCDEMQGYLFSPARPAAEIGPLFLGKQRKTAAA
jgi:predicted signal transduction protein with EAL and GGDEF domain